MIGLAFHPDKTHLSAQEEALGIVFSFIKGKFFVSISETRQKEILALIDKVCDAAVVQNADLASMIGRCQHVMFATTGASLNPVLQPLRAHELFTRDRKWKNCPPIGVNQRLALAFLRDLIFENKLQEVVAAPAWGCADYTIITDASWNTCDAKGKLMNPAARFGWICIIVTSLKDRLWKFYSTKIRRRDIAFRSSQPVTFLEALAPVCALERFKFPERSKFLFAIDNAPAISILQRNSASTPQSTILAFSFHQFLAKFAIRPMFFWVPSKLNLADAGTRSEYKSFLEENHSHLFHGFFPLYEENQPNVARDICGLRYAPFVKEGVVKIFRDSLAGVSPADKATSNQDLDLANPVEGAPEVDRLDFQASVAMEHLLQKED